MEKSTFEKQIAELASLQPIPVPFKGDVRLVHYFHPGTAERFDRVLEMASVSDTMQERHRHQIEMLATVLSDLHDTSRHFMGLRRWLWVQRLKHSRYDEVEALQLLDAAVTRIRQGHLLEMICFAQLAQIQSLINQTGKEVTNE